MCLIGLGAVAIVATVAFIRSRRIVNKLAVASFFLTTTAYFAGVFDVFLS